MQAAYQSTQVLEIGLGRGEKLGGWIHKEKVIW